MHTPTKENKILIFLKEFIRIRGVINWCAISFMGFILGVSSGFPARYTIPILVHIVSTFCILSFTFGINNYYDAESDKRNPRRVHINAIASGKLTKKTGATFNIIFMTIPLTLCGLYSILHDNIGIILFCIVLLFWTWSYSAPPLRTKGRPPIDMIWHFFAFLFFILWGSIVAGSITFESWLIGISGAILSCVAQVENHILDYQFDKETGTKTFAVWAGLTNAETIDTLLLILHMVILIPIILLYSLSYPITILLLAIGIVVGLFTFLKPKKVSLFTRDYVVSIFSLTISVYLGCLIYHLSFVAGVPPLNLLGFLGIP
jgi:4-hydroxybenzoate polyprenyltransferase